MAKSTYTIPTHLRREDQILSLGLISLNARQLMMLIIAGGMTYNFILRGTWLDQTLVGMCLHYFLIAIFAGAMALLIFGKAQGRAFDLWLLILFRYWSSPRRFIWQSCRVAADEDREAEATEEDNQPSISTEEED